MQELTAKATELLCGKTLTENPNVELGTLECVEALESMTEMYLNELMTKEKIVNDIKPTTPSLTLATYTHVWEASPYLDSSFCTLIFQRLDLNSCL